MKKTIKNHKCLIFQAKLFILILYVYSNFWSSLFSNNALNFYFGKRRPLLISGQSLYESNPKLTLVSTNCKLRMRKQKVSNFFSYFNKFCSATEVPLRAGRKFYTNFRQRWTRSLTLPFPNQGRWNHYLGA